MIIEVIHIFYEVMISMEINADLFSMSVSVDFTAFSLWEKSNLMVLSKLLPRVSEIIIITIIIITIIMI